MAVENKFGLSTIVVAESKKRCMNIVFAAQDKPKQIEHKMKAMITNADHQTCARRITA